MEYLDVQICAFFRRLFGKKSTTSGSDSSPVQPVAPQQDSRIETSSGPAAEVSYYLTDEWQRALAEVHRAEEMEYLDVQICAFFGRHFANIKQSLFPTSRASALQDSFPNEKGKEGEAISLDRTGLPERFDRQQEGLRPRRKARVSLELYADPFLTSYGLDTRETALSTDSGPFGRADKASVIQQFGPYADGRSHRHYA